MTSWEWGLVILLAVSAVQQAAATVLFWFRSRPRPTPQPEPSSLPPVAVLLPIRGIDDRLRETIRGLKNQDYPSVSVRIILDDPDGTAEPLLRDELQDAANFDIQPLVTRLTTCGLKNSAVLQAMETLPAECEVVAFIDSDVVPHETWLSELVAPLASDQADCTYGCRWYTVPDRRLGTVWRYVWCAASIVSSTVRNLPWGGSLAVRRAILDEPELRERWKHAGCEDLPLSSHLRRTKRKLQCVTRLVMVESSSCSLESYRTFVTRQMLWVRLYRPDAFWPASVIYVGTTISLWGLTIAAFLRMTQANWTILGQLLGVLAIYLGLAFGLLLLIEKRVRGLLAHRKTLARSFGIPSRLLMLAASWLTPELIFQAIVKRRIVWRGVTYDVRKPYGVQRLTRDANDTTEETTQPMMSR
ncbi:glycosyltransferase [Thalassoroseus pseudoceratinae]|uniref:glycosyltransferase n=1 Tax=Thalassoroseus pseudoceratinae TaxID=2713176 RepID=UPI001422F2BA|nr:glycosyltransferase family 2 protein [Thalassoroseus pseudoceratinae]